MVYYRYTILNKLRKVI